MAIAYGTMLLSEKRNARVTITPQSPATTLTIASATVTLYDSSGNVAGGVSAASATFDTGAQAAPRVWFLLRPSVLAIVPGVYSVAFLVTDSAGFVYEPVLSITIKADGS